MRHFILLISCLLSALVLSGQSNTRQGKDYALFFAVNDYQNMTDLRNPIQNARDIAAELREDYGFEAEVVENPSLTTIEDKLEDYKVKFASGAFDQKGQLLIFFTGHGTMQGRNGYFMPGDVNPNLAHRTGLDYDYLRYTIDNFACQHILVAVDACHSGTFDPDFGKNDRNFGRKGANQDQVLLHHGAYRARLFITSDAQGKETPDNSNLARKFLLALRSHRSATGYLTHDELMGSYLKQASPIPGGGEFGSDEAASRFLFFRQVGGHGPTPQEQSIWDFAVQQRTVANYQFYLNNFSQGYYRAEAQAALTELNKAPVALAESSNNKVPDFMAFIPGGSFQMGDTVEDDMGEEDEKPVHEVSLSDFYLARNEVSVADFARFVDATRYVTDAERDGGSKKWTGGKWEKVPGSSWRDNTYFKPRPVAEYDHPVIHVSWNDAVRYCNWLSREHGLEQVYTMVGETVSANWSAKGYRLPTEAEWEYAARSGGKDYLYAWGNGEPNGNVLDETTAKAFNHTGEKFSGYTDGYATTAPVGSFPQGRFGLSDMTGNVFEWCWDWYAKDYYGKSPVSNPRGAELDSNRVFRGGSWYFNPSSCLAADRYSFVPTYRDNYVGFRLARSY